MTACLLFLHVVEDCYLLLRLLLLCDLQLLLYISNFVMALIVLHSCNKGEV